MKNKSFRKYLTDVLIFTVAYFGNIWIIDEVFNGVVLEAVYALFPKSIALLISRFRVLLAFGVYLFAVGVFTVIKLYRMQKAVMLAARALEERELLERNCPRELEEFRERLAELQDAAETDRQARKLAEQQKNDLIVYLAHDLKTPLTSVIGYLSLLAESPDLPADQRVRYTGIALDKAYRLEYLVNEFFDTTRLNLQSALADKETVDLTVLLLQMGEEFYPMMGEKGMTLSASIDSDLLTEGNGDLLARVFENLLRNGVSYGLPETEILCTACREGNTVAVTLENAAEPLSTRQLERLFDKFYRPDTARGASRGGAGLGLAIAKQILELHGGTVEAAYEGGKMRFTVRLPAKE